MTVTSLILGLDVSPRRLGWGLVSLIDGSPVACGMEPIDLPDHGWQHEQVWRALQAVSKQSEWYQLAEPWGEIQAVYIERPMGQRSRGAAYDAGRAVQAAQAEVERRWPWAPIEWLQPNDWKSLAGLKGNASKEEVLRVATIVAKPFSLGPGFDVLSQDAADALLIAVAGWHRNEHTNARAAEIAGRTA